MLPEAEYRSRIFSLQKAGNHREAYGLLGEALSAYPESRHLLASEVFLLFRLRRVKEARRKAEERMDLLKGDPFFLKTYIMILERLGARDEIEEVVERRLLAGRVPAPDLYVFAVQVVERTSGRGRAAALAARALEAFPESSVIRNLLGSLKRGEAAAPPTGRYRFYKEKYGGRKIDEVIGEIEMIRVLPEFERDHELLLYLAELYKKRGDLDRAIDLYMKVLAMRDDLFARKMLGYAHYRRGDLEKALSFLKGIFLKDPDDNYLKSTILRIFKEKKDPEGLARLVEEALALNPEAKHLYGMTAKANKWPKDSES